MQKRKVALEISMLARSVLVAVVMGLASPASGQATPPNDACMTQKYLAHRKIAREFQTLRAAILAEAVPEARAVIEANRDLELANNDRMEVAFRHFLATDRSQLNLDEPVNAWVILSPEMSGAIAAKNTDFAAATKRAEDALARQKAAGAFPRVREVAGAMFNDPSSKLVIATKAAAEAFAKNSTTTCN